AEVGDIAISRYAFAERVQQQIQRLMAESGGTATREDILNAGGPQMVLGQMIQETLMNLESKHLGLTVSDEAIRTQIQSIKIFQNEKGQFDRNRFDQILRSINMSEDSFIEEVRGELTREQLADAVVVGATVPDIMVERLFEAQYQTRLASMLVISPKEIPTPPSPSRESLEAFYNDHQKNFQIPELRTFTAFIIDPSLVAKNIPLTEEEIQSLYEAKKESFSNKTLKEVRPLIVAELQKEKANEITFRLTQDLDDKIAGGATVEEIAPTVESSKLITLENVTHLGRDSTDIPSAQLPQNNELSQEILRSAFTLEEASDIPFTQAKNGEYYIVRVDKIQPPFLPAFSEITEHVLKVWITQEQLKAAKAKAEELVRAVNLGKPQVVKMTPLPKLSLSEPSPNVSDEVKTLVFSLRPNKAGVTETKEGFVVVVLKQITHPPAKTKE
ncbi:MAG TPA: hypothetical protein DEP85_06505, partial [Holosporales bacterium]|nr:hypothetical protein [Holosporales bacterium]